MQKILELTARIGDPLKRVTVAGGLQVLLDVVQYTHKTSPPSTANLGAASFIKAANFA